MTRRVLWENRSNKRIAPEVQGFIHGDYNNFYSAFTCVDLETTSLSTLAAMQHSPAGMGLPWGQVRGCPRNVQMRSVASGERMCSNLQASSATSASSCTWNVWVKSRS